MGLPHQGPAPESRTPVILLSFHQIMGTLEAPALVVCKARRRGIVVTMPRRSNAADGQRWGVPRGGWPLLGCACVIRRRHSYNYASSSFLVSLQNHLSQCAHY